MAYSSSGSNLTRSVSKRYSALPIYETVENGFFTVNRQWQVLYWNYAAEKLSGIRSADIIGKKLRGKTGALLSSTMELIFKNAFLPAQPIQFEEHWGVMGAWSEVISYHAAETLSVSFKGGNHSAKATKQQLKNFNDLYQYVTEITNDCLWEWDLVHKSIFWIDGGHKRMFGYPVANALIPEAFWANNIHADDKARVLDKLARTIAQTTPGLWEADYRFKKVGGDYAWVQDRGHIISENGNPVRIIGATRDVSEKIVLENLLESTIQTKQKDITRAVLTAQENERSEIGREMHDNVNQVLGATKLYIEMGKTDQPNRVLYLEKASGYIVDVIEEIRRLSRTLLPPGLGTISLYDSIKILLEDCSLVRAIDIKFDNSGMDNRILDANLQMNIFRIVQEQMNNVLKHAHASNVSVKLSCNKDQVLLAITDDGKGFDRKEKSNGVGLRNIMSRAELYHGHVEIISTPGKGFQLRVSIPYRKTGLTA